MKSNQSFFGRADSEQIDNGRQAFSAYFDEDGDAYRFEVSAPGNASFDAVWETVGHWLKYQADTEWSDENLEFAIKANSLAMAMRLLPLFEKAGMEIIPVPECEAMDYVEDDCEESENTRGRVIDVGGDLTKLNAEIVGGIEGLGGYCRFRGPFDLETELGGGVKIRLCNRLFADNVTMGP